MAIDTASTALQNLVTSFNAQTQAVNQQSGQYTSPTYNLTPQTESGVVIILGAARLVHICVIESGVGTVKFYNSETINDLPASNLAYVLPANTPIGITQVGMIFNNGIIMVLGEGVSVNCTYSTLRV